MTLTVHSIADPDAREQLAASLRERQAQQATRQPRDARGRFVTQLAERAAADDVDDPVTHPVVWMLIGAVIALVVVAGVALVWGVV